MKRIAIIIPYFGQWPPWMELYLYSCSRNPTIDILFFTDCPSPGDTEHVKFHSTTFDECCKRAASLLNVRFAPHRPYKLCDLRPFYGYLHRQELAGYDFWGFGDIDLVYGDLSGFVNDCALDRYDILSTHADRISGHFCLLRNNEANRNIGFRIKGWESLLENEANVGMDERHLSQVIVPEMKLVKIFYGRILRRIFPIGTAFRIHNRAIVPLVRQICRQEHRRLYFREMDTTPEIWPARSMEYIYRNGCIFERKTGKERIYRHFLFFKKNPYRSCYLWNEQTPLTVPYPEKSVEHPLYIDAQGIHYQHKQKAKCERSFT